MNVKCGLNKQGTKSNGKWTNKQISTKIIIVATSASERKRRLILFYEEFSFSFYLPKFNAVNIFYRLCK